MATVDDVVIVDSGSTDDTLQRAQQVRPDVRIFFHEFKDFGDQRNWALGHVEPRHRWVLFVDADEYCDAALLTEIAGFITAPGADVGGYIAGRNYFLGRWLRYCTMYPSYQLRLLKLGEVHYRKDGHGQREVTKGSLRYFRHGWRHESFSKGVDQWVARHNHYASEEAERYLGELNQPIPWRSLGSDRIGRRRVLKAIALRLPLRPWLRFAYSYLIRGGFLDGRAGLQYCLLLLAYHLVIRAKIAELKYLQRS